MFLVGSLGKEAQDVVCSDGGLLEVRDMAALVDQVNLHVLDLRTKLVGETWRQNLVLLAPQDEGALGDGGDEAVHAVTAALHEIDVGGQPRGEAGVETAAQHRILGGEGLVHVRHQPRGRAQLLAAEVLHGQDVEWREQELGEGGDGGVASAVDEYELVHEVWVTDRKVNRTGASERGSNKNDLFLYFLLAEAEEMRAYDFRVQSPVETNERLPSCNLRSVRKTEA
mmetsp:Transcript_17631/g.30367  ORF Transcript_17631/g.30367 Transcript_17631/m.30367 type:complete len:226 (+) Transcript_17631:527-1204(+)